MAPQAFFPENIIFNHGRKHEIACHQVKEQILKEYGYRGYQLLAGSTHSHLNCHCCWEFYGVSLWSILGKRTTLNETVNTHTPTPEDSHYFPTDPKKQQQANHTNQMISVKNILKWSGVIGKNYYQFLQYSLS